MRRAVYRTLVARELLMTCDGGTRRAATLKQDERFAQLKHFAAIKGADHSLWLGQNDWNAVAPVTDRKTCQAGDEAYQAALADYRDHLDRLAGAVAEHRE